MISAHLFICSLLPSGNQKHSRNCDLCAHRHTSRAGRNCGLQRSTTRSRNCICRTFIVFELSGLLVFGVVSPLAHQQFCLWGMIWSTSTISFTTWSTGNDSLLHDSELSIPQWSKFALSQSCCLRWTFCCETLLHSSTSPPLTISFKSGHWYVDWNHAQLQRFPQWRRVHPSISNQTTSLRSILEDHSLSTYCTSTWEAVLDKCCTIGISTICSRGWSCIPGTCFELSSPASQRLDGITEDHHSCAHRSISFQTYCHRVCLITRVPTWYPDHLRHRQDHPCRRWLHQRCQDSAHWFESYFTASDSPD